MVNSFMLTVQLLIAITGSVINIVALHEALLTYRILSVLNLNGIREVVAIGDVIDEILRLCGNAGIMAVTIMVIIDSDEMFHWYMRWIVVAITIILATQALNRIFTRKKVIRIMAITEGTPKRRAGDRG